MAPHCSSGSDTSASKVWGSWLHIPREIAATPERQERQAHCLPHPHHVSFQKQPASPITAIVPYGASPLAHSKVWISGLEILPELGFPLFP